MTAYTKYPREDIVGPEDQNKVLPAGGPPSQQNLHPMGQRVPGGTALPNEAGSVPGDARPEDTTSFGEDETKFPSNKGPGYPGPPTVSGGNAPREGVLSGTDDYALPTAGGPATREDPQLGRGLLRTEYGCLSDVGFTSIEDIDYASGKVDGDGRTLVYGSPVNHVLLYDATQDPWHTPAAGFYGYGRDGNSYWDGQACLVGTLGTLAGGINRRCWNPPQEPLSSPLLSYYTYSMYADDKVLMTWNTPSSPASSNAMSSFGKWVLVGDFDISVEFEAYSYTAQGGNGGIYFQAAIDGRNYFFAGRAWQAQYWWGNSVDGSWSGGLGAGAGTSGKLRLTRVGTTVTSWYWTGSAWAQISGGRTNKADPVYVGLNAYFDSVVNTGSARWFNFQVNSGTISYKAGWAREAAGTTRGSRADFPTKALLVSTGSSLDIIDADTSKLWMSFRKGSNNALHTFQGGEKVWFASMKDGVLSVAYGTDPLVSEEGGEIVVDFNLDTTRIGRGQTSSVTGTFLRDTFSSDNDQSGTALGSITSRNSAVGYMSYDYDSWRTAGYRIYATALGVSGAYLYRAACGAPGLAIHKWKRWYYYATAPDNYNSPYWAFQALTSTTFYWAWFDPSTLDLYYMSGTSLYRTLKATWEAAFNGGTFAADSTAALPGTRTLQTQYRAVKYGTNTVYTPANEGVYQTTFIGGVSTLVYGKAGSGAAYEILPSYDRVTAITYAQDGSFNLLIVAYEVGSISGIAIVNLDSNTIYGLVPLRLAMSSAKALAA